MKRPPAWLAVLVITAAMAALFTWVALTASVDHPPDLMSDVLPQPPPPTTRNPP